MKIGNKIIILIVNLLIFSFVAKSQICIQNGKNSIEISGGISTYYNYRFLKSGEDNKQHNKFALRDAQLQLEGRYGKTFEYELQIDFADLPSSEQDPENPGLMDAYIIYKGLKFIDIKFGYGKLPYSRVSQVPFIYSAYWQRAEFLRGDLFSRRDIGLTLNKTFWKQRISLIGGAYNGLGEVSLSANNDASGMPEFVGRGEIAYPARYRYTEIDTKNTPIPMFVFGFNARTYNKVLPEGKYFPPLSGGKYDIKMISGKRNMFGIDLSCQYKGFSLQYEYHLMKATPSDTNHYHLANLTGKETGGFFKAGGQMLQANYFIKRLDLITSIRYEYFNINDLVLGEEQRFNLAIAYQINGFNSMIKAQYTKILSEESNQTLKWVSQFRIGWQFLFK